MSDVMGGVMGGRGEWCRIERELQMKKEGSKKGKVRGG